MTLIVSILLSELYILFTKNGPFFFADTTVNENPTAQDIVDITALVAKIVNRFKITPRIALLSYSNFGASKDKECTKIADAIKQIHQEYPNVVIDGEIQAGFALNAEISTAPTRHRLLMIEAQFREILLYIVLIDKTQKDFLPKYLTFEISNEKRNIN